MPTVTRPPLPNGYRPPVALPPAAKAETARDVARMRLREDGWIPYARLDHIGAPDVVALHPRTGRVMRIAVRAASYARVVDHERVLTWTARRLPEHVDIVMVYDHDDGTAWPCTRRGGRALDLTEG